VGLEFTTIEGPLDDAGLGRIASLYGAHVDARYRDREFVRTVFNGNPSGRSYHVFVLDGDRAVGHYAVIPFPIARRRAGRTERVAAGKAEALFLDPSYRSAKAANGVHAGMHLMNTGHAFARDRGLQLLFSLPGPDVGLILRATGFKVIKATLDQRYFLLRPGKIRQLRSNPRLLAAGRALGLAQRGLDTVAGAIARADVGVAPARALPAAPADESWSVEMSEDAVRWWKAFGYLEILAVDGNPDTFVAFTRGREAGNSEIIDWHLNGAGAVKSTAVLHRVIDVARHDGTLAVSFAPAAAPASLRRAATLLGFASRRIERLLYVHSADPFFHDPAHLRFNWLFTI